MQTPEQVLSLLRRRGQTLGCAESLTGGMLSASLTSVPGASEVFVGAVVSYATAVKRSLLGVTSSSVVTREAALEMAAGARSALGCDWAVAVTGVAGPDLQDGVAVGTVFVAVVGRGVSRSRELSLTGSRDEIRQATVAGALALLVETLG